ncbi:MAG: nickel pincer cofactor biosynthesis protein LarB [Thermodesulfobacteriota bacterium]|nr:nickel pincer cofactor biosynthesis protein LarB [Thermodesulfobacteriota bacterium]
MNLKLLKNLLQGVKRGEVEVDEALDSLKTLPFEDIGHATVDHHRHLRLGFPEVIFGEGKSDEDIISITQSMVEKGENILVTRVDREKAQRVKDIFPDAQYHPKPNAITIVNQEIKEGGRGTVLVISAGTSDMPVAEEALLTAYMMGNKVDRLYDVGVAGIHRLMSQMKRLFDASVLVVVAGMEGALPSVVGGLVAKPIIAVPTSIGYGANFGGITALLGMLNSCAPGVAVTNIDNGFGAGYIASLINRA